MKGNPYKIRRLLGHVDTRTFLGKMIVKTLELGTDNDFTDMLTDLRREFIKDPTVLGRIMTPEDFAEIEELLISHG